MKALSACLFFFIISTANVFSQVGIGTITPNSSAMLDVTSTTQGMLTPRMTTAQRIAIATPADGLMVYDTDLKSFFHFNGGISSWNIMNSGTAGRLKFKRIRSTDVLATVLAAELAAGGQSKYILDSTTYYEINGTVTFNFPIDLNNAYVSGQDTNDDIIVRNGNLFEGSTGGSIRNVTIRVTGGTVFNISAANTQNLIFRDLVVSNCANVGSISGLGLVFISTVQFVGNTTGITYNNINQLLLNNVGWFGNNLGTYEKLTGTFGLVQKQGGFSEVNGSAIGFDVSSNPVITGDAVLETVVFTGTNVAGYIKGYTPAVYTGYNFNNKWSVRSAGIPNESDEAAVGDINYNYPVGQGAGTTLSGTPRKLSGLTTSNNLYRFSQGGADNKLQYLGAKKRFFRVSGSASFQSNANATVYVFYVAKNGVVVNQSKVYVSSNSTNDILAVPIEAIIEMNTNDFIEIFAERFSGSGNILTVSMNLVVN
ncbi:MAG: hypothetical protein I4O51_01820 [Flavobacterium micromati]|nr:hypothetical protein [Flavobacterium micromati]